MSNEQKTIQTIFVPKRLQIDTVVALVLLRKYGEKYYPGVSTAVLTFFRQPPEGKTAEQLEQEGILPVDMLGGVFDHHRETRSQETESVSQLVAKELKIQDDPALKKLLRFAYRDDIEGKGVLSKDAIDRSFGLPGLLNNLVRQYPEDPQRVFDIVEPVILGHLAEETMRHHVLPDDYRKKFDEGKVDAFLIPFRGKELRALTIDSDRKGMVGFLKAHPNIKADIVAQRFASGHINVVTNQQLTLDLAGVAERIRLAEAKARNMHESEFDASKLRDRARTDDFPMWYLDDTSRTVQNGGIDPEGTEPTKLSLEDVKLAIVEGLNDSDSQKKERVSSDKHPRSSKNRNSERVVYTALFVDDVAALKAAFPPVHPNEQYHHSTIQYKPNDGINGISVGAKHSIRVKGRVTTDAIDALLVENDASENAYPHITLSTAEGVRPVQSNEEIETAAKRGEIVPLDATIQVTEGYYDGSRDVTQ